jgi:hypothetical protein
MLLYLPKGRKEKRKKGKKGLTFQQEMSGLLKVGSYIISN